VAPIVTVALPVLNGGPLLGEVLAAVGEQDVDREVELLVIDSGSTDGSVALARSHGARVVEIARSEFSHGGTRNRLMELAAGDHVAFLTQDSLPAGRGWLTALLHGFLLARDVALVSGPSLPRPDASPMVRRELEEFFATFGGVRVDRSDPALGPATFCSLRDDVAADRAFMRRHGLEDQTVRSLKHHTARALGRSLGTNADGLPAWARRRLSLDGRATFEAR
jgi:glycosyltransferase involved in cell wall biosynthesis